LFAEHFKTGGGVVDAEDSRGGVVEFVEGGEVEGMDVCVFLLFEDVDGLVVGCRFFGFQPERDPPEVCIFFWFCIAWESIEGKVGGLPVLMKRDCSMPMPSISSATVRTG